MAQFRIFKLVPNDYSVEGKPFKEGDTTKMPTLGGYLLSLKATTGFDHVGLSDVDAERHLATEAAISERAEQEKVAEAQAAERKQQAARAEIYRLTDPEGYAEEVRRTQCQLHYETLCEYATDDEKAALKAALGLDPVPAAE